MTTSKERFQYRVVNVGMFNTADRMVQALAELGADGWRLVSSYDKASNWFQGMEKGFLIFLRHVPAGESPEGPWAAVHGASQEGYNAW